MDGPGGPQGRTRHCLERRGSGRSSLLRALVQRVQRAEEGGALSETVGQLPWEPLPEGSREGFCRQGTGGEVRPSWHSALE